MESTQNRFPIGLCIYGIGYSTGLVGRGTPRAYAHQLNADDVLDLTARLGLSSVEAHLDYFAPGGEENTLRNLRARADDLGLGVVLAGGKIESASLQRDLHYAQLLGANVVRCVISGILCGDRRPIGGLEGWQRHLAQTTEALKKVAPAAEDAGIRIGVENHQDATSADLIALCQEVDSPNIGVTLDTGNPLAVAEEPVAFARRILPHLVHVHLKDYRLMRTEAGYRLYHCPIGAGVVDFAALFQLFATKPEVKRHLEMAALGERHIRMLEDEYWAGLGDRPVGEVAPVLRLREAGETHVPWQTPWETGDEAILPAWEMARLDESVARMKQLLV
jgi:sugar phosphate isomerase/epimerase